MEKQLQDTDEKIKKIEKANKDEIKQLEVKVRNYLIVYIFFHSGLSEFSIIRDGLGKRRIRDFGGRGL